MPVGGGPVDPGYGVSVERPDQGLPPNVPGYNPPIGAAVPTPQRGRS